MIDDIKNNEIDCVIVKDLSRLGRDYIDMGYYLEKFFPANKIRFIAIDDNIDSARNKNNLTSIEVPIKNVINDYYAQDISKKVRSALDTKRKNGEFIGAFAPYGYKKSSSNKNKLIIDKDVQSVITKIFKMILNGYSQSGIARELNRLNIPCPSEYKKSKGYKYQNANKLSNTNYWTYSTVRRILQNEVYTGALVQKKAEVISYKVKKKIALPTEDYIKVYDTHEPIIDRITFNQVQDLLSRKSKTLSNINKVNLFAGYLKCGDCGRAMTIRKSVNKKLNYSYCYYICGTYRVYGKKYCSSHSIKAEELEEIILQYIRKCVKEYFDPKKIEKIKDCTSENKIIYNKINDLKKRKSDIIKLKQSIYEDWKLSNITKEEYLKFKENYEIENNKIDEDLNTLHDEINNTKSFQRHEQQWTENLIKHNYVDKLDRETLIELIDYIEIFGNKQIKIHPKFRIK